MSKSNEGWSGCIVAILVIIFALVVAPIVGGLVLTQLWDWFIVTTFAAAPIGIFQAIGLSLVIAWFFRHIKRDDTKYKEVKSVAALLGTQIFYTAFEALFQLGFGWIIYSLMIR